MVIISVANGTPQTYKVISQDNRTVGGNMVSSGYSDISPVGEGPYTVQFFNGAPWSLSSELRDVQADAWILYNGVTGSTTLEGGPTFPLNQNP